MVNSALRYELPRLSCFLFKHYMSDIRKAELEYDLTTSHLSLSIVIICTRIEEHSTISVCN